jgi:hypothetical protein
MARRIVPGTLYHDDVQASDILRVSADLSGAGYALIPHHLTEPALTEVVEECRGLLERGEHTGRHPGSWDEISNVGNVSEVLAPVILDPVILALAVLQLGPDIELASPGEIDRKLPRSKANECGWHTDFTWMPFVPRPRPFFWLTAYFFLTDVTEDSGPLWVVPSSHRWVAEPDDALVRWTDSGNQIPGVRPLTGPAGTLMVFNNEIWHRSPPNASGVDRLVLRVQVKPAWMKAWGHGHIDSQSALMAIDEPHVRQVTGSLDYDDVPWEYGDDAMYARFPVVRWLETRGLLDPSTLEQHKQSTEATSQLVREWSSRSQLSRRA